MAGVWASLIATYPWTNKEGIDPFVLLEFFCDCQLYKVYPPGWIMDALADIFRSYVVARKKGIGKKLGEYFGEGRAKDWQRISAPPMSLACFDVYVLDNYYRLGREAALSIVASSLEAAQAPEHLPTGWRSRTKIKGRGALEDEYDRQRPSIEKTTNIRGDIGQEYPTEIYDAVLLRQTEEALTSYPVLRQLRGLKENSSPAKS